MHVREGSNLSIKHPHMDVVNANCLAHDVVTHQNRASIIRLICIEPLFFGHMWYVHL